MKTAVVLALLASACNFQFHSGMQAGVGGRAGTTATGSRTAAGSPAAETRRPGGDGPLVPTSSFALSVDGTPELLSRFGMAPNSAGGAICRWQYATAVRAHLGGGKYGNMQVEWHYATPTDEVGPCGTLAAKGPSASELLAVARRGNPDAVLGATWMTDDWTVQFEEGNPVQMVRDAHILKVIRKAGKVRAIAPLDSAFLTSEEMKQQVANVCRFPDGAAIPRPGTCSIESAAVQHVVRFFDDDDEKYQSYEVFANVKVNLRGVPGVCEMRIVVTNIDGKLKVGEGQCRHEAVANASAWDSRCFTVTCVEATAQSRAGGKPPR
jgi:hypothetical protein